MTSTPTTSLAPFELFAFVQVTPNGPTSSYFNVARIRLDSMGPGIPPP